MKLPRGFRFIPSDGDLLYFLNEKVNLGKTICQFLGECDMYGNKEPWDIWNDHGGLNVKKGEDLYFFTKLKKVSVNGKRINRRVGSGTWSGANCGEVVEGVGEKRHFRYENNGGRDHGAWIMHEYSLLHNDHHAHGDDEYVLCRLRRKINEDCGRERKRRKLMINDNIIQENPLSSSRISVYHEEEHHHNQRQPTQLYHHRETNNLHQETMNINNPIQKVDGLFPRDDEADKLMEYYLNLNEQEKWSLSSSSSNGTGGAAADHLNNINIQVEQQDDQQHRADNNNTNNPISSNDLIDWGVMFEDDDELKAIMNWDDEFCVHKKSSSTAGAEILLEDHQEAGQQDEATAKSSITDDHVVVVEDEGLDKFAEKLEDILELEIDDDHDDLMEISREGFQAHMDHDNDHRVEVDQQEHINNEGKDSNMSTSSISDDHVVVVEDDHQDHDEVLDKFVEELEDILELEIDHDDHHLMELSSEDLDFQAHMDHHDHQVEGDQQQHIIINEGEQGVLEIDEDGIDNIDGTSFAQELQKIPLYFAELPPDDQLEDILDDDVFNF